MAATSLPIPLLEAARASETGRDPMSTATWFSLKIEANGATDHDLVPAVADRRIFVWRMRFIPGSNNIIQLYSGPSASNDELTGAMTVLASQLVAFDEGLMTNDDNVALVLDSTNAVLHSGYVCGWYF